LCVLLCVSKILECYFSFVNHFFGGVKFAAENNLAIQLNCLKAETATLLLKYEHYSALAKENQIWRVKTND
jgi:hypothetical protein